MSATLYGAGPLGSSPRLPHDPMGAVVIYGAPSSPEPWTPPIDPHDPGGISDSIRKFAESQKVQPPPPYADDAETAVIAAIAKLDEAARARVLRYLTSRYGEQKP